MDAGSQTPADRAPSRRDAKGPPTLCIVEGDRERFDRSGLARFEPLMGYAAAAESITRAVPGRFTARLELPGAPGEPSAVYFLKRYRRRNAARAAAHEWRLLGETEARGIPCPRRVALGERRGLWGPVESLLVTAALPDATQADWWIRERPARRAELLSAVAALARRFHQAGLYHQDFYLCHFFVREPAGGMELSLIDFQRAGLHRGRRRWIVKDLAELLFSLRQEGYGPADRSRFLELYGLSELYGDGAKGLERAIEAKAARIARHVPKYG